MAGTRWAVMSPYRETPPKFIPAPWFETILAGSRSALLKSGNEPFAQHVALAGGHERDTGTDERAQHFEIVAHVIAVVVGEEHKHRIRMFVRDVAYEPFLGGVLGRLLDRKTAPPGVIPDPSVA